MSFTSIDFLLFFIPVLLIYWWLPKKFQMYFLLFASYAFMSASNRWFAVLLGITTVLTYVCAKMLERSEKKRLWITVGLGFLFGQLFISKYLGLFGLRGLHLLIPLGLSFYTFQTAGYLLDLYAGKSKLADFTHFALFVSFFPSVTAGPIERGDKLIPQFEKTHAFEYAKVSSGMQLFTLGLFKKMVIADNLAIPVDKVFASLTVYRGLSLVIALVLFSWQLYFDFSGYSDMARGIARILGFEIEINFKNPYFATSVQNFWRRWHISLSSWFRDYLYIPLGGSRKGSLRTVLNVIIVFTLCGLWHGAALTFVVWGLAHGMLIASERLVKHYLPKFHVPHVVSMIYTYSVVVLTWVLFRSSTLQDATYIYTNAFVGLKNFIRPQYIQATLSQLFDTNREEMIIVGLLFCVGICLEVISYQWDAGTLIKKLPRSVRFSLYIIAITMIVLLRQATIQKFIYVQF